MKPSFCFLLPSVSTHPVGGYKVVYEYSNRLVQSGFNVSIVYPASLYFAEQSLFQKSKSIARYFYYLLNKKYEPYHWFNLDKKIKLYWSKSLNKRHLPKAAIYIATSAETAEYLNLCDLPTASKFYFVQGYESWGIGEERFIDTLKSPLNKITISTHLSNIIKGFEQPSHLVFNGFDFTYFKKTIDFSNKNKYNVSMLYHISPLKGCQDGLNALKIVKKKYPQLTATFFGYPARPLGLPEWVTYFRTPDKITHNKIYNEAAIFIGPSHSEGFCLTPPEAMQCGSAIVCTDIGGYADVCIHEKTALVSPVKNVDKLADNIIRLIENDELRYEIAKNGYDNIQSFTWDLAYSNFKLAILNAAK